LQKRGSCRSDFQKRNKKKGFSLGQAEGKKRGYPTQEEGEKMPTLDGKGGKEEEQPAVRGASFEKKGG